MQNLKKLIATENRHQILLGAVFLIYIVANIQTPHALAEMVNTTVGNAIVIILGLSMIAAANPVVGILGIVAAYELIRRSGGMSATIRDMPSEVTRLANMNKYNDFPKTLEEEIVNKMAPLVHHPAAPGADYKPVLNDIQDAAPINYEGVI